MNLGLTTGVELDVADPAVVLQARRHIAGSVSRGALVNFAIVIGTATIILIRDCVNKAVSEVNIKLDGVSNPR